MKLLVFAHTPPPHHGQSYMVQLMIEGLGGDARRRQKSNPQSAIECYHVNSRYSDGHEDIGSFRLEKTGLVLRYCVEAIWCRFRYGLDACYYVPAPGKRWALYRDWITMLFCRPFYRRFIYHWHAVGLSEWLQREGSWWERWITQRLLGRPTLGIALAIPSMRDALWLRSLHVEVVPNGIPDPCPDFETVVRGRRRALRAARTRLLAGELPTEEERAQCGGDPAILRVLFLSHCAPEKGLFDTLDAIAMANRTLHNSGAPWSMHLTVAGLFVSEADEAEFNRRVAGDDLAGAVTYAGFASGEAKAALLRACDTLCFPTYYAAESFGLVLVEAMSAGMNVVATRWRANADVLPIDHPGLVPVHAPEKIAESLIQTFARDASDLRACVMENYTVRRFVETFQTAVQTALATPDASRR